MDMNSDSGLTFELLKRKNEINSFYYKPHQGTEL
jgi:hypothetical protein